jgi:hypothetical protein
MARPGDRRCRCFGYFGMRPAQKQLIFAPILCLSARLGIAQPAALESR